MSKIQSKPKAEPAQGKRLAKRNAKGGTSFWHRLWAQRELWIMLLPGILYFAIFHYGPMYGLRLAFMNYSPILGYDRSPWVGFDNFERLFIKNQELFLSMLSNTLFLGLITFGTSFPLTIIFSLILNYETFPYNHCPCISKHSIDCQLSGK